MNTFVLILDSWYQLMSHLDDAKEAQRKSCANESIMSLEINEQWDRNSDALAFDQCTRHILAAVQLGHTYAFCPLFREQWQHLLRRKGYSVGLTNHAFQDLLGNKYPSGRALHVVWTRA